MKKFLSEDSANAAQWISMLERVVPRTMPDAVPRIEADAAENSDEEDENNENVDEKQGRRKRKCVLLFEDSKALREPTERTMWCLLTCVYHYGTRVLTRRRSFDDRRYRRLRSAYSIDSSIHRFDFVSAIALYLSIIVGIERV